jgi:hypothetical protein
VDRVLDADGGFAAGGSRLSVAAELDLRSVVAPFLTTVVQGLAKLMPS